MIVGIAGSRKIKLSVYQIDNIVKESGFNISGIVSGKEPNGVDACGEAWARWKQIPLVKEFPPEWDNFNLPKNIIKINQFGKPYNSYSGIYRNHLMVDYLKQNNGALIVIWRKDSSGSSGKDLTGLKFTSLEVVELSGMGQHGKEYFCKCDCGNEKVIRGSLLTSGAVKSCGCHVYVTEHWNFGKLKPSDATSKIGEKFNRLTIEGIEHIVKNGKPLGYLMICRCECGNLTKQVYADIAKSKVVSCGCWQKEKASITGSTVGWNNAKKKYNWFFYKNGTKTYCRSGYEVLYANYLYECGEDFEYEGKYFKLQNGKRYTPDFYLTNCDTYVEIKGALRKESSEKIELFSKEYKLKVMFWSDIVTTCNLPFNSYSTYFKNAALKNLHITDYLANKEYKYLIC